MKNYSFAFIIICTTVLICSQNSFANQIKKVTDYDGDGLGDIVFYNPSTAQFTIRKSSDLQFETSKVSTSSAGDLPALGDYNGDGKADLATYNRSTAVFHVAITDGDETTVSLGSTGDLPVPADYANRGCTSYATFNPQTALWTIADCSGENSITYTHGAEGSIPLPGDYDCDGKADSMVFNRQDNTWTLRKSSNTSSEFFYFGLPGDFPIAGDYNGDGCTNAAVYRPASGHFFYNTSYEPGEVGEVAPFTQWGLPGDLPTLLNVDGDQKVDFTIFRPSDLSYYIKTSTNVFFLVSFANQAQSILSLANIGAPALHTTQTQKIPGDYNGDGRSDVVTATVDRTLEQTTFNVLHANGTESSFVIGAAGDAIVPGDYNGDGKTQAAVVYVNTSTAGLEWYILNPDNTETVSNFGLNQDFPLAGDFDCDGKDDKAVVRTVDAFKHWFIDLSAGGEIEDYLFGLADDKAYAADVTGNGCDELIVSREADVTTTVDWFYRGLNETTDNFIQWGLPGDKTLTPADLNGDGKADFLVTRDIGGGIYAFQRFSENSFLMTVFGLTSTDEPLTGRFTGTHYNEFGVYRRASSTAGQSNFFIRNFAGGQNMKTFGQRSHILVRPDGTAVAFSNTPAPGPTPGEPTAGCTPTAGTESDFKDGRGNALWKPISEGVNNRAPAILLPKNPYCDLEKSGQITVTILGSDGSIVSDLQKRHCNGHNAERAHYWSRKTASQLAAFAPITVKIEHSGITECRVVVNPTQRND